MSLLRAVSTMGSLTMVSRVLGFVRDVLMARMLGAGAMADCFVLAFKLPNLMRGSAFPFSDTFLAGVGLASPSGIICALAGYLP